MFGRLIFTESSFCTSARVQLRAVKGELNISNDASLFTGVFHEF